MLLTEPKARIGWVVVSLVCLALSSRAIAQKGYTVERDVKKISLPYDSLKVPAQRDFFINKVVDVRTDTSTLGSALIGTMIMKPAALEFNSPSTTRYLRSWLYFTLSPRPGQRPLTLQILTLHCQETLPGKLYYATCDLTVRFLLQDSTGIRNYGELSAFAEHRSMGHKNINENNIRECFEQVMKQFYEARPEGTLTKTQASTKEFRPAYPWPQYRISYPDSMKDGLYSSIESFRDAKPDPNPPVVKKERFVVAEINELRVTYADGPEAGKPIMEGEFMVEKGQAFIRSGKYFVLLKPDQNGFYIDARSRETLSNNPGAGSFGLIGAAILLATSDGGHAAGSDTNHGVTIQTRLILDMRNGQVVPEKYWAAYLNQ